MQDNNVCAVFLFFFSVLVWGNKMAFVQPSAHFYERTPGMTSRTLGINQYDTPLGPNVNG